MNPAMLSMFGPYGAAAGVGLSLFGGISGLLSGANAEHQAEVAAENSIRDFRGSSDTQRLNMLAGGTAGLEGLSGGLNNALVSGGRSLGAALAGAGVNNSTATAGAVANQAAANAGVESRYASGLAQELLAQESSANGQAAQMQYGLSVNNMNFAREQEQGAVSGLNQFFGQLGQMNFGGAGGSRAGVGSPQTSSVLPPTNGIVQPDQNQYGSGGLGGAMRSGGLY
jgi:hypothetical protein